MNLNEIRNEIDSIDKEIVSLLLKRMAASAKVAAYKIENKMPVYDKAREDALLEKIESLSMDMSPYTKEIYLEILKQSKLFQTQIIDNGETSDEN